MILQLGLSLALATVITAPAASSRATPPTAPPASTSGAPPIARDAVATLAEVCLPVLHGAGLAAKARAAGFRLKDGTWTLALPGARSIDLNPPDPANPHECGAMITSASTNAAALQSAIGAWARTQSLTAVKTDVHATGPSANWVTSTWIGQTPSGEEGVALSQEQPASASPKALSPSNLLISLTSS